MVLQATEDKLLALFGTTGLLTLAAEFLQQNPDARLQAVGGLLVAIGVCLKAFWPAPKPAPAPVQ